LIKCTKTLVFASLPYKYFVAACQIASNL